MGELETDEMLAYRVVTGVTDEKTAHRLIDEMADAGIARDRLKVEEVRLEVDDGV